MVAAVLYLLNTLSFLIGLFTELGVYAVMGLLISVGVEIGFWMRLVQQASCRTTWTSGCL